MPSASHGNKHQHDHHRNGDEATAAAAISPAAAIVVISAATAAGRAAEVAVESRHVLGIARVALAEIAVIAVCDCIFLRLKCVLLLFLSLFYQERCPIKIPCLCIRKNKCFEKGDFIMKTFPKATLHCPLA